MFKSDVLYKLLNLSKHRDSVDFNDTRDYIQHYKNSALHTTLHEFCSAGSDTTPSLSYDRETLFSCK